MRSRLLLLIPALLLTACTLTLPAPTGAPATGTQAPALEATPVATEEATAEATTEAQPEGATVNVDENLNGTSILVDNEGFPFYTFTGTEEPADFVGFERAEAGEADTVGAGLDMAQLGSIDREDGFSQLTYAGRPLYHYRGTTVTGSDSTAEFANVGPQGELVGEGVGDDPGAIDGSEEMTPTEEITGTGG